MTYDTTSKSVVEDYTSSTVKQLPDETSGFSWSKERIVFLL